MRVVTSRGSESTLLPSRVRTASSRPVRASQPAGAMTARSMSLRMLASPRAMDPKRMTVFCVVAGRFAYRVCQRGDRIEEDAQGRDREVVLIDGVYACPTDGLGVDQPELAQRLQCLLDRPQAVVIADERMDLPSRQGSICAQECR
jgi:hypothetical protein